MTLLTRDGIVHRFGSKLEARRSQGLRKAEWALFRNAVAAREPELRRHALLQEKNAPLTAQQSFLDEFRAEHRGRVDHGSAFAFVDSSALQQRPAPDRQEW